MDPDLDKPGYFEPEKDGGATNSTNQDNNSKVLS